MSKPLKTRPFDNQSGSGTDSFLAPLPFTLYISAAKKSGKTTLLLNMLNDSNYLKGKFNRIIFVSPTASMDNKIQGLRSVEGLVSPNRKLIGLLKKIQQKRKESILEDDIKTVPSISDIPTVLTDSDFHEKLEIDYLLSLLNDQKTIIQNFGKEYADQILIILDDSIKDKILKSNKFEDFIFKSRHYNMSVIFISQAYFALSKSLRLNNSQFLVFETGNINELKSIYEENNQGLDFKTFVSIFRDITSKPYSFLNINWMNSKIKRLIRNFEEFIDISKY